MCLVPCVKPYGLSGWECRGRSAENTYSSLNPDNPRNPQAGDTSRTITAWVLEVSSFVAGILSKTSTGGKGAEEEMSVAEWVEGKGVDDVGTPWKFSANVMTLLFPK